MGQSSDTVVRTDERRDAINQRLPCRSLHNQPPLIALPEAVHSQRHYRLEWEEEMLDLRRVHVLLATGRWFRQSSCHGEFWLGMQHYNQAAPGPSPLSRSLSIPPRWSSPPRTKGGEDQTIQGSGFDQSGPDGRLTTVSLPNYQLSLPFTRGDWCKMQLAALATGTTL